MDNCDIEWFALEMNRDQSVVFEIASKYCISDSLVDHDGYSISSPLTAAHKPISAQPSKFLGSPNGLYTASVSLQFPWRLPSNHPPWINLLT